MRKKLGAALMIALLVGTSACGGGSRPSQGDIEKALKKGDNSTLGDFKDLKLNDKGVSCIAKAIEDSGISDAGVKALVDNKKSYKPTSGDTKAATALTSKMVKCVPGASSSAK